MIASFRTGCSCPPARNKGSRGALFVRRQVSTMPALQRHGQIRAVFHNHGKVSQTTDPRITFDIIQPLVTLEPCLVMEAPLKHHASIASRGRQQGVKDPLRNELVALGGEVEPVVEVPGPRGRAPSAKGTLEPVGKPAFFGGEVMASCWMVSDGWYCFLMVDDG